MEVSHVCINCAHATPDTKFENLNLEGGPTLVRCPFQTFARIVDEPACEEYKPKPSH